MEEAYHAYKKGDKDKLKERTQEVIILEQQGAAFDALVPLVKLVQKNVKALIKTDECPEEYRTAVASIIYFSSVYGMPSFERFTQQLVYRYGQKYVERITTKHKDVAEDIYTNLNYKPSKDEIKERSKDLQSLSKKRAKEETKLIAASNEALVSSIRDLPSSIAAAATAASASSAKKPSKGAKNGKKNGKKAAKKESSSESESESDYDSDYDSDYESESSDEKKKPVKKNKKEDKTEKKEKKDKKEKKAKKAKEETDSEDSDDVPVAAEPVAQPAQETPVEQPKEEPEIAQEETVKEEVPKTTQA